MAETTEIEKKSLEAHVELCAERYRHLEEKLEIVDERLSGLDSMVRQVRDILENITQKRNDQVLAWAIGSLVASVGIIGYLLSVYVIK